MPGLVRAFAGSDAWTPVAQFVDANASGGNAANINTTPHASGANAHNTRRRSTEPRARERAFSLAPTLATKPKWE